MSTLPRRPRLDVVPISNSPEAGLNGPLGETHEEKALLGSILQNNAHLQDVDAGLRVSDFVLPSHRVIYSRMLHMKVSHQGIDLVTLSHQLSRFNELEKVGGAAYIASLTEELPPRISLVDWIKIVSDKSITRQVVERCQQVIADSASSTGPDQLSELSVSLLEIAAQSKATWLVAEKQEAFAGGLQFLSNTQKSVQWAVEGLIQKKGNGVIVGDPGASKSLVALDLLVHLVAGRSWMGCTIPSPMSVALISREDAPDLTQHRLLSLMEGATDEVKDALFALNIDERMFFSTRAQMDTFTLQKESDVVAIITGLKKNKVEFAVFDVFRRLWDGDENDNQEVAKVLAILTRIQTECQCSVALIHHLNKSDNAGNIFSRIRGASSIYGWREWAFGINVVNPEEPVEDHIRKITFETKAALPSNPIHYQIGGYTGCTTIQRCAPPLTKKKSGKAKDTAAWSDRG